MREYIQGLGTTLYMNWDVSDEKGLSAAVDALAVIITAVGTPPAPKTVIEPPKRSDIYYLDTMQSEVKEWCETKGWTSLPRSFGEDIALLHSEASEALEAYRDGIFDTRPDDSGKPIGVGSELADVLIRLLDTAERYGFNLTAEYNNKMRYNHTRAYRHGGKAL